MTLLPVGIDGVTVGVPWGLWDRRCPVGTTGVQCGRNTVLLMYSCMYTGAVGPLPDQGKEQRVERNETGTGQSWETQGSFRDLSSSIIRGKQSARYGTHSLYSVILNAIYAGVGWVWD